MSTGFVYVLTNPCMQGMVKIGHSARLPEERAQELYRSTGVPAAFHVAHHEALSAFVEAEKEVHKRLDIYRVNKDREFFRCPLDLAIQVVTDVAAQMRTVPMEQETWVQRCAREAEEWRTKEEENRLEIRRQGKAIAIRCCRCLGPVDGHAVYCGSCESFRLQTPLLGKPASPKPKPPPEPNKCRRCGDHLPAGIFFCPPCEVLRDRRLS